MSLILDETDTALVRYFRTRRHLFHGLVASAFALPTIAFVFAPLIRGAL